MWRFDEIKTLLDIPRYWARVSPDKVAIRDGRSAVTYSELERNSNRIANRIVECGIQPGARIGYVGRNSIEFFEIWFGACKAGCAIAPLTGAAPYQSLSIWLMMPVHLWFSLKTFIQRPKCSR
ncbi:MAG: AMP-binding protein [Porticoccaceae bacterium]